MKKRIAKLYRFSSDLKIKAEHHFKANCYHVDQECNIYRDGEIVHLKADARDTKTITLRDDDNTPVRFKTYAIGMQTFYPDGIADGRSVDHRDRNRKNNNVHKNLRWASRNTQHLNRENVEYKKKRVRCIETGVTYDSAKEAELACGITKNTIARAARESTRRAGGLSWECA